MKKNDKTCPINYLLIFIGTPVLSTITYCKFFNVKFVDVWYKIDFILWMSILNGYSINFIINDYKYNNYNT